MYITGINPDFVWDGSSDDDPGFSPGVWGATEDGRVYQWCSPGSSSWDAGQFCQMDDDFNGCVPVTQTNDRTGARIGLAVSDVDANGWGWLLIFGQGDGNVAASDVAGAKQYTTATGGRVDDASSSAKEIAGLRLYSAPGAAAARRSCILTFPHLL